MQVCVPAGNSTHQTEQSQRQFYVVKDLSYSPEEFQTNISFQGAFKQASKSTRGQNRPKLTS